jgi:tetratricopeptide (TPR) repeat protein
MWHFARGAAYAAKGKTDQAQAELTELERIAEGPEAEALNSPTLPVTGILKVARLVLAGNVAGARGEHADAIARLEQAVAAQDELPYMEPPFWHYPVRQTLGAALLRNGDHARAEEIFREDLKRTPRNGWGLLGLAESLRKQGNMIAAASVERERQKAWQHADVELKLEWF